MAGLLDMLQTASQDPATSQGILRFGLSLLQSKGGLGNAIGQAGVQGLQGAQDYRQQQFQRQVQQSQLDQIKRQKAIQDLAPQFMRPAEKLPTQDNADVGQPGEPPVTPAYFDAPGYATQLMGLDPMAGLQMQALTKKQEPKFETLKPGEVGGTFQNGKFIPAYTAPAKDDQPSAIKEYLYAKQQGYPGLYEQWAKEQANLKAPKTNITVPVSMSTEKKYGEQFAGKIAESDTSLMDAAQKAPEIANRAIRIKQILSGGNAITGIGADWRLGASKALAAIGGKSSGNAAADTEVLAAQLAGGTLDQIKSSGLGGGNGFTNTDREFLEKAASGKITMERDSLLRLADLNHRAAVMSADKWNKRSKQIPRSAVEGTGLDMTPVTIPQLDSGGDVRSQADEILRRGR